ncbi:MAG: hypothetical protein HY306_11890 [Nitrosomonadales bacterium]|nr:hypothetical protein [Nitrosomonadales bacterium]
MLGLFGKKTDHPMADIKSAQALLDDLPKNDALKALHEISSWIESVREQDAFRVDHQFAVLRLLDEAARPFERKLARDYFSATTLSTFQENRLWLGLNEFYGQLAQAYRQLLARYCNDDKGSSPIKSLLPLLAVRAIYAVAGRLKCAAAHYALVEPEVWQCLADFYSHAETQRYADEAVAPYAGYGASVTARYSFAGVLMWYASCAGSLTRLSLHLAERLLAHLCSNLSVDMQHGANSLFGFDLQHPAQPVRAIVENGQRPGLRYLGVHDIQPKFGALLGMLGKGVVPEAINLGGVYGVDAVRDAVRYLAGCLGLPPPKRRNARRSIKVNLSVASGFSCVVEHTDVGLNFGDDSSLTWEIDEISAGGFRCVLPASRANGVAIGMLIGIKPEKLERWGIGIVRRLSRDAGNNLQIGVEILANQMAGVVLRDQLLGEEQAALWLNTPDTDAGEVSILMNADAYSDIRSLNVHLGGKHYLLMPQGLQERGADYDLARYRKIEQDAGGSDEAY